MNSRISIELGALAPPLAEQLGLESTERLDHLQKDADALTRLRVRGLLTERESTAASKRLVKRIVSLARVARAGADLTRLEAAGD